MAARQGRAPPERGKVRTLDHYISAHVVRTSALVLCVLMALFAFVEFIDDVGSVGKGRYTTLRALEHMVLTLPGLAFNLFPLAAVIGSLMGLGVLASNAELTVMQSAGVSSSRIAAAVMKAAAWLVLASIVVGEAIAPFTEQVASERRATAIAGELSLGNKRGVWLRDGDAFVNIRQVLAEDRLGEVYTYEFDERGGLRRITRAAGARFEAGSWWLEDARRTIIEDGGVRGETLDRARWDVGFGPEMVSVVAREPESLSALGLYRYLQYLRANEQSSVRIELALWSKLVYPLATGVMIFLALPLVLGGLRRVGIGQRIFVGALIGIAFHVIQQVSSHLGLVYGLAPWLSAAAPTVVFLALGLWMMRRLAR